MRIVSLIPSATEILFAVGAGDDVVGVTFECDHPPAARERRVVSTSAMPEGLTPKEIDDFVAAAMTAGEDLYRLDSGALAELDADLVVTQDLCAVCAVDVGTVDDALSFLGCRADVATIDPHTLDDVLASIVEVGRLTDRREEAAAVVASLEERLAVVAARVAGRPRPRVLVLEWTDPPFAPGHWIPEMVTRAGGEPTIGVAGTRSSRITWEEAVGSRPDLVVCAPCGFDLDGSTALAKDVRHRFPDVPVWAVDADGHFARPGPRLVDGVEVLAGILHPEPGPAPVHARRI
ncbi:iron complex transport system substrate-binding protein [Nocardioides alpinus]|uniref:Cobalamin-binding protein n=1 Tax=Nocardioides alpinus TaxID=748909 RepID=A0A1I0VAQ9_9ACTN|nr:cobalamin-binding protein [Nocardioides alpinus]PKH37152.1 cobalamin-binding protein [Nocardioides alpinus]SFA73113.1 iron complex transport system substrate-binding protein [Nocardioides alpinus]